MATRYHILYRHCLSRPSLRSRFYRMGGWTFNRKRRHSRALSRELQNVEKHVDCDARGYQRTQHASARCQQLLHAYRQCTIAARHRQNAREKEGT